MAAIAGRQQRAITTAQLRDAGLSDEAIRYRVESTRLRRLWRGVYVVGPEPPDRLALANGATLVTGAGLSRHWAAWLWEMSSSATRPVDVTVTRGSHRGPRGIRVHQARSLETTHRHGIPVTTPAQTCLDLAGVLDLGELERIVARGHVKKILREADLRAIIAANPRRPGVAKLRAVLADGPQYTMEESERVMLALLREADLPPCQTQVPIGRYVVDFCWPEYGLIVEVDGFAAHGHRRAFEYDRRRQQELTAAGHRVMPVTWLQMKHERVAVAVRIGRALGPVG